eukprot:GHVS01031100.1.p1 GENE.GHVS01031100.1~~GHVS01031100.1.p1  ORF type:complete len:859 (+),score=242.68 GHVS01031100.1:296-2872(+)
MIQSCHYPTTATATMGSSGRRRQQTNINNSAYTITERQKPVSPQPSGELLPSSAATTGVSFLLAAARPVSSSTSQYSRTNSPSCYEQQNYYHHRQQQQPPVRNSSSRWASSHNASVAIRFPYAIHSIAISPYIFSNTSTLNTSSRASPGITKTSSSRLRRLLYPTATSSSGRTSGGAQPTSSSSTTTAADSNTDSSDLLLPPPLDCDRRFNNNSDCLLLATASGNRRAFQQVNTFMLHPQSATLQPLRSYPHCFTPTHIGWIPLNNNTTTYNNNNSYVSCGSAANNNSSVGWQDGIASFNTSHNYQLQQQQPSSGGCSDISPYLLFTTSDFLRIFNGQDQIAVLDHNNNNTSTTNSSSATTTTGCCLSNSSLLLSPQRKSYYPTSNTAAPVCCSITAGDWCSADITKIATGGLDGRVVLWDLSAQTSSRSVVVAVAGTGGGGVGSLANSSGDVGGVKSAAVMDVLFAPAFGDMSGGGCVVACALSNGDVVIADTRERDAPLTIRADAVQKNRLSKLCWLTGGSGLGYVAQTNIETGDIAIFELRKGEAVYSTPAYTIGGGMRGSSCGACANAQEADGLLVGRHDGALEKWNVLSPRVPSSRFHQPMDVNNNNNQTFQIPLPLCSLPSRGISAHPPPAMFASGPTQTYNLNRRNTRQHHRTSAARTNSAYGGGTPAGSRGTSIASRGWCGVGSSEQPMTSKMDEQQWRRERMDLDEGYCAVVSDVKASKEATSFCVSPATTTTRSATTTACCPFAAIGVTKSYIRNNNCRLLSSCEEISGGKVVVGSGELLWDDSTGCTEQLIDERYYLHLVRIDNTETGSSGGGSGGGSAGCGGAAGGGGGWFVDGTGSRYKRKLYES